MGCRLITGLTLASDPSNAVCAPRHSSNSHISTDTTILTAILGPTTAPCKYLSVHCFTYNGGCHQGLSQETWGPKLAISNFFAVLFLKGHLYKLRLLEVGLTAKKWLEQSLKPPSDYSTYWELYYLRCSTTSLLKDR